MKFYPITLKYVTILWTLLLSEGGGVLSWGVDRQLSNKQKVDEIVNMMTYISAILRPCDLKVGMYEV
jgi:hypothetical protein